MEQRPLRLGDLVDDYCPRERRITNHAIVALVGESIRQTRCTTCDAEHVFKGGKMPLKRAKGTAKSELDDNAGGQLVTPREPVNAEPEPEEVIEVAASAEAGQADAPAASDEANGNVNGDDNRVQEVAWSNRTLIRATLPRTEGELPPPRPIPEFTMHRYNARGGRGGHGFRHGRGGWDHGFGGNANGNGNSNGNVNGNVNGNHNGNRGDRRQGQGGFGGGQGQGQGHGHGRRRRGKNRPR